MFNSTKNTFPFMSRSHFFGDSNFYKYLAHTELLMSRVGNF